MNCNFLSFFKSKKTGLYLLLITLCLPLFFINLRSCHDWGDDFAQYINQAKNIIEGLPQSNTGYVYSTNNAVLGPPAYLIGFPLILAPVYYFFGNNIMVFLILINVFLTFLAVFVFRFFIKQFSLLTTFLLVIIFTYNPWLLNFKAEIMSEIPFTLLLLVTLELYNKLKGSKSFFGQIFLGLLIGFLVSIRPTGAVFILAISVVIIKNLVTTIKNRNFKLVWETTLYNSISIFTALIFFFFLNKVLFQIPSGAVLSYSYIFKLHSLVSIISQNFAFYFEVIKMFFSTDNYYLKFATIFTQSAFLIFAVIGWTKKVLTKPAFTELLVALFVMLILVYPYTGGLRFLLPILPFLLYYAVLSAKELIMPINLKFRKIIIVLIGLSVLIQYKESIAYIIKNNESILWGPQHKASKEAFEFIKTNLPQNAVIEFEKPRALSLYTGRHGFHANNRLPLDTIKNDLEKAGVTYILDLQEPIEKYPENNLRTYILENANHLKTIWSNEKFTLYKIDKTLNQSLEEFNRFKFKTPVFESKITFDTLISEQWQNIISTSEVSFSDKKSCMVTKDMIYGLTFRTDNLKAITQKSRLLFFKSYFFQDTINDCDIVVSISEKSKNIFYKSYNLKEILKSKNEWEKVELLFDLPKVNSKEYEFTLYIWNIGKSHLYVDDFEFRIY